MLPLQPYHEGSYPPGPKFPQLGDDTIGGYLNAHAALAEKRRNMMPYHIGRLAQDGFLPLNALPSQVPASPHNPEDQATQAFDGFDRPPPSAPPAHGTQEPGPISPAPEQHYIGDAGGADGEESDVPQASRSGRFLSGVARLAGNGALSLGGLLVKGVARGAMTAVDLAAGANHAIVPPEDRPHIEEEPVQGSWFYPGPKKPQRKFVDVAPYNGTGDHAIPISSDEEEEAPGPAAAARRPRNSVRKSDLERANETLAVMGPNVGRGHRRRGAYVNGGLS